MTCRRIEGESLVERYLAGSLPNAERKAFEEHYFACDHCFEALEAARLARSALLDAGPAAFQVGSRRSSPRSWMWRVPVGIAAAIAVAVIGLKVAQRPDATVYKPAASEPRRNPNLELLARVDPPAYSAPKYRNAPNPDARRFAAAMENYVHGDYPATVLALRPLLAGSQGLDALFFTAACHLLMGETDTAILKLLSVSEAGDRSPYLEESYYLLAKAYVKTNRMAQARTNLERVVGLNGDLRNQAKDLLDQLP